ncbi:hypothetical protein Bca52824_062920 [Brassica carinata]|uniref:Cytochrome c-type biogenesis protein n=1 Tax=Brassica carinata TaxID=52824 RepID=A0A8X7U6S5_BRACI|nr:hypothetical protein Bca52824_062920 [Brassica carinata]
MSDEEEEEEGNGEKRRGSEEGSDAGRSSQKHQPQLSQADVAILLRQLIRDEIGAGKTDKEIYSKLEDEFGETVLYAPKFDMQTAALWLTPVLIAGGTAAGLVYSKHRQRTNVHIMALDLIRGVSLTPKERVTILDLLIPPPPPPQGVASRLRRWLNLR